MWKKGLVSIDLMTFCVIRLTDHLLVIVGSDDEKLDIMKRGGWLFGTIDFQTILIKGLNELIYV